MNKILGSLLVVMLVVPFGVKAQIPLQFTLEQVVDMATKQSPESKRANTQLDNSYWNFRTFKANYLPALSLSGNAFNYDRSITPTLQPDGTESFQSRQQNNSDLQLSLDQNVGLTGGSFGLVSTLNRIDIFQDSINTTSYLAQPLSIRYSQPILRFNSLRWDKKIEPMRYEESVREYNENMENVAVQVSDLFFALLVAQKTYEIAEKNLANNDTNYQIAQGRYNLGKIAENDLLQMELAVMNSRTSLTQASLDIKQANLRLAIFLGLTGKEEITLIPPSTVFTFEVDEQVALQKALENRKESVRFERQRLEAEREVAKARGDNGFGANVNATYGVTNNADVLQSTYQDVRDFQRVSLNLSIPILDWGRGRGRIRTAMANQELSNLSVQQDELNFKQEVLLLVNRFKISRDQLEIATKSDAVAQKRYDISKKRYEVGKIDILDLNIALTEKDQAKQSYLGALRTYWSNYFELRRRTLYDFRTGQNISYR